MNLLWLTVLITCSFFVGSIPFGFIIAKKYYGINIQEYGSGNIGSTNVNRIIGKKASLATQVLDILKGLIPVLIGIILFKNKIPGLSDNVILIIAAAAILGHDFSPFLNFNGGKGVNTTLGASLLIAPIPTFVSVLIFYIVKRIGSYVSLASVFIGISLPLAAWVLNYKFNVILYFLFSGFLIVIRHKDNLKRLFEGKENK